jgi:hypothetical protein
VSDLGRAAVTERLRLASGGDDRRRSTLPLLLLKERRERPEYMSLFTPNDDMHILLRERTKAKLNRFPINSRSTNNHNPV